MKVSGHFNFFGRGRKWVKCTFPFTFREQQLCLHHKQITPRKVCTLGGSGKRTPAKKNNNKKKGRFSSKVHNLSRRWTDVGQRGVGLVIS